MPFNRIKNLCSSLVGLMVGRLADAHKGHRQGRGVSLPRPAAELRPVFSRFSFCTTLLAAVIIFGLMPRLAVAASHGDSIVNRAFFSSLEFPPATTSVTVTVVTRTPSTVEFLKYAPGATGTTPLNVPPTSYSNGSGSFNLLPPPQAAGSGAPISLAASLPLMPYRIFHAGEPLFIRLTDLDQNINRGQAESVLVTVSDPKTGDTETLLLTESGPDTGVFIGYIQTSIAGSVTNNGVLSVVTASTINAFYTDIVDGSDSSADAALVDPFGLVFNTVTGNPVNGATVELLNADGTAAAVFGDSGLATNHYPNSVISGSITTVDAEGNTYTFTPGGYRFPFVAPGSYFLRVTPPAGYNSPSTVSTTIIQTLPGAPFTILEPGSRGEVFIVPAGPAIRIDIPLDPLSGSLWLRKTASRNTVSAGEILAYEVTLENTDPFGTAYTTIVTDTLPPGFRYQHGSTRLNGVTAADPAVSADGSTLTFPVGTIGPKSAALLRYVVAVGVGARSGTAVNTATAVTSPPIPANVAQAAVQVQEPFMQSRTLIMGRVIVGSCSDDIEDDRKGMEGIGIYLEDGTFVLSDKRGMFHFNGIRPGTHVVQLDLDSIPDGYKIQPCEQNSRFAGRAYSQFVDLQGGTMWRTDFHLRRVEPSPPPAGQPDKKGGASAAAAAELGMSPPVTAGYNGELELEMISSQDGDYIDYRLPLQTFDTPLTNLRINVSLPPGAIYIKGSSRLDETVTPDPEITVVQKLVYNLGSAGIDWQKELRFRITIDRSAQAGELQTRAELSFDTPSAKGISAPAVDNLLALVKTVQNLALPPIIVRPHFPTFAAELSEDDRKQLDELAQMLAQLTFDQIEVTGHTDIVRIAPRSRHIYADNTALSFARAKSVGRYLTAALHLPPEKLNLGGNGERSPLATNRTAKGRALNRRVEVKVLATETKETTSLKIIKERSGLKKKDIQNAAVTPAAAEQQLPKPMQTQNQTVSTVQSAPPTAVMTAAENIPVATSSRQQKTRQEKIASAVNDERVELFSALSEGIVHYRLRLAGIKKPLQKVTATLVTPKSQLYINGTSNLSGTPTADPETKEAVITYNFANLPDVNKFDLRLQALIDGDNQAEALSSSVTVVLDDADGNPVKTYTATAELSDNMEEINRVEIPVTPEVVSPLQQKAKTEAENSSEFVEKVSGKGASIKTEAADTNADLHVKEAEGILSPADGAMIASRINAVRIVLGSGLIPVLSLDGKEIPAERIGFKMKDRESEKSLYTYIGVDFGDAGEHILQLKGIDPFGQTRFDRSAKVTRTGEITSLRLVAADGNLADGRTPVRVHLQMFDKDDKPVMANAELTLKGGELRPLSASGNTGRDAGLGTVSIDSQGWINFQPVSASGLYRAQLAYNKATIDIETYVKPVMRDWILVGLAEGTVGYSTVSGHMENLKSSGQDEHFYDKERLAFYAKGTIKGEWLLTMAYDSAKQKTGVSGNALFQNIDPNSYYTLYGDSTAQGYDAASQKKLYLKIERDQFYALYGDYDTGLSVTELSRYSRRMNGIKAEYRSKDYDLTAFGSETGQSFVKDEIRGDGTSGLYRLRKKGIVINSEKITIESRDRFHSETITDSRQLSRFIDYSIDYDAGTIFFKGPVPSRDERLDPVYIIVDYEIDNAGKDALTYGGHAAAKMMNGRVQIGGTYVHEGHLNGSNNLYGVDATAILSPETKARVEFATTNNGAAANQSGNAYQLTTTNSAAGGRQSGNAYLAEVVHSGKTMDGKLYFREQEKGFGLSQQSGGETGTRKFGAEGGYRLNKEITLNSQVYRQYNLTDGAVRDFMDVLASFNEKQYTLRTGIRYANDALPDSSNTASVLATVGGSWKSANQRLTLRADHEQALLSKNSTDFPTRTIFGADYQATKAVMLFAQEELTYGAAENTNTTRVGVKSTPWSGGTLNSTVVNDLKENSERTFATAGLAQKWQVNPHWTVDGGLDRSQTIRKRTGYQLYANVPPTSGGENFTAVSLGANYQDKKLTWSNRAEYRNSSLEDKWGLTSGVINERGLNWGWTARLQLFHTQSVGGSRRTDGDLRFGLAYRPPVTKWIVLNRLDLITSDERSSILSAKGKRIINNLNANYRPDKRTQVSIQYGAKYVVEKIDVTEYSGYTDLIGFEGRYDITKEMDIGLRCSLLHTWETNQFAYSFGPSVGYNLMENAWLSLGYNVAGFNDKDFSAANYTAQGPFMQFRMKFDQNSIKDGLKALNQ